MLAQTLVLLAAIAVFGATAVAGVAGAARARTAELATAAIAPGVETALGAYVHQIGVTIAAQAAAPAGVAAAAPPVLDALNGRTAFASARYVEAVTGSPLTIAVTVTPTATSVPACDPSTPGSNAGPDIEIDGQCSPFVGESRLSLAIEADAGIADRDAIVTPLAHRRTLVTLRLFAQPPFAMVAGAKDAVLPGDAHEGDVDGYGNALGSFLPADGLPGDTTIHVVYRCTPALGDCSASFPRPADAPTSLPWTNGNAER
jgi:hypothetical protein